MQFLSRYVSAAKDLVASVGNAPGDGPQAAHNMCLMLEQIGVGIVLSVFLGMVGRFLPFYCTVGALALGAGVAWQLGSRFSVGSGTFLVLSSMYLLLAQPSLVLVFSLVAALSAAGMAGWKVSGIWLRLGAALGAFIGTLAATLALYWVLAIVVLPAVHPLTVALWNISPLVAVGTTVAVVGYCSFRQPASQHTWYWLATPVLAALFTATFWPSHSYLGMAIGGLTAAALSIVSFVHRPTEDKEQRSHFNFVATAAVGLAFCAMFWVSNSWTWLYRYQMANAVTVTRADQVPATNNNRLVPFSAAQDYCAQQNVETNTALSTVPAPLVMADDKGENHFYWQCIRHPTKWQGHYLTWLTGAAEGVILADAGEKGRFGQIIETDFIFGDTSMFTLGAFYARHPGAEMQAGMVGRMSNGESRILIPYVSKVMQWGAMVPELSGVMAVSPYGFIEDYTPSQAAAAFPGVRFMPSELARQYADLWAQESSLFEKHVAGNIWEVSEFAGEGDNRYPFWQDFKNEGLMGVIPFEPVGKDQKALMAIGLFDRAELSMTVVDMSKSGLPGPRQIANVALSHPGMFNVKAGEALLVVPESGHIYWLTAMIQTDARVQQNLHGYTRNVLYDGHAQNYWDIESAAKLNATVSEAERTTGSGAPAAGSVAPVKAAPAAPVAPVAPAPVAPSPVAPAAPAPADPAVDPTAITKP